MYIYEQFKNKLGTGNCQIFELEYYEIIKSCITKRWVLEFSKEGSWHCWLDQTFKSQKSNFFDRPFRYLHKVFKACEWSRSLRMSNAQSSRDNLFASMSVLKGKKLLTILLLLLLRELTKESVCSNCCVLMFLIYSSSYLFFILGLASSQCDQIKIAKCL